MRMHSLYLNNGDTLFHWNDHPTEKINVTVIDTIPVSDEIGGFIEIVNYALIDEINVNELGSTRSMSLKKKELEAI